MPKSDYMPKDDEGKAQLFVLFRDNIGAQLATLGIAAADPDIVQQAADATRFRAIVDFNNSMQQAAQAWTAEKNYERDGGASAPASQPVPVLPAGFPATVPPGIVARFRALVKRVKAANNYIETIGQSVGIEGSQHTGPHDPAGFQCPDQRQQCVRQLGMERQRGVPRHDRVASGSRRRQGLRVSDLQHDARLHGHRASPRRAGQVDLPRHLSRGRRAGGRLEQAGECDGGRIIPMPEGK